MTCYMCSRSLHGRPHFNGISSNDSHAYADAPTNSSCNNEPEAPTLSLGNRILWLTEFRAASGIVRWIGRLPAVSNDWTAGIEFDNAMPDGGSGDFHGRQYFRSRIGHSLFLPISDVLKVDSENDRNSASERTSFFGRLQDSYANFAQRKRRDSTFGHFKQDFCSSCVQNDFSNYSHYCHHVPVYDRISSRRSLCYDDHPYEMYNACVPCHMTTNVPKNIHQERVRSRQREDHNVPIIASNRMPVLRPVNRCEEYPAENVSRFNSMRKDSFFFQRPNLSFIDGFKDWVTSLMVGTNRRKKKNKIVIKDRKSLTSVFFSQNGQSITGQRLSSFADYASVSITRAPKQNAVSVTEVKEVEIDPIAEKKTEPKMKQRKKRPAPLPPAQQKTNIKVDKNYRSAADTKTDSIRKDNDAVNSKGTKFKIVRSSSIRIHSGPRRHKSKKRRAPAPPVLYSSVNFKDKKITSDVNAPGPSSENPDKKDEKMRYQKNVNRSERNSSRLPSRKARNKVLYQHIKNRNFINGYSDSGQESDSEESKSSTNSLSFSEDNSEGDKYGLVKYGIVNKVKPSGNRDLDLPNTSNYVQYSNDNSDVCLKISIQKTETNVVTVEEVSTPYSTTHYTIEEDSTSSELSDVPNIGITTLKAITDQEPEANAVDSSSLSTAEETSDKSNTIFEELQMKPPVKGSVKDFVNAFNMLATKSVNPAPDRKPISDSSLLANQNSASKTANLAAKSKDNQSFPTQWEYQNKGPNVVYSTNNFLLPIAEESVNETSEHDGNVSVDDSKTMSTRHKSKVSAASVSNGSNDKKCSHCSETHSQALNHKEVASKSLKKRMAPRKDRKLYESVQPLKSTSSTQASLAALSSLLHDKSPSNSKEDNNSNHHFSAKSSVKLDQPIMVGLYIEDKSSHRGPIPLLITPSMSLMKLKKQIEKEYDFPRYQQCWILGENFAVADDASLASYGVTEPGCPVLLYVMAKDSKSHSLPGRSFQKVHSKYHPNVSDSSEEDVHTKYQGHKKSSGVSADKKNIRKESDMLGAIPKTERNQVSLPKAPPSRKRTDGKIKKDKSEFHKKWEKEFEKKGDYHTLLALDDVDLVANVERFECPVCFLDVEVGEGAILQECLHSFCKECLAGAIQFSDNAVVKCPFRNEEYSCDSHLQEREVKSLVTPEVYDRHLQRSMALAESQAQDSFHCKTPDCPGWCLFEDNVNTFLCPVCKHNNCLTCAAIHEGKNCRQFQDDVAFRCDSSEEARKTKEYLQNMVDNGEAMRCPKCQVILMKKWGCDWLKCSMCHTEVCWVTKGPRWGPGGKGDTSGGCKCMVNGTRCHPKCSYCH